MQVLISLFVVFFRKVPLALRRMVEDGFVSGLIALYHILRVGGLGYDKGFVVRESTCCGVGCQWEA